MHKGPRGTEAVESGHVVAIQDVRGLDKKQNGKGWSDEGVSYTVDTHATQGVATCEIDTVGTLRTRRPGEGGVQGDFDHIVPAISPALNTQSGSHHAPDTKAYVAFSSNMSTPDCQTDGSTPTLKLGGHGGGNPPAVSMLSTVRRLTPVECERLQGFPDNFTAIPWRKKGAEDCPDGPRYKALGNSMAVPVMRWIGERIRLIDDYISII
jgi:site-specific DNA-cytosine methylase